MKNLNGLKGKEKQRKMSANFSRGVVGEAASRAVGMEIQDAATGGGYESLAGAAIDIRRPFDGTQPELTADEQRAAARDFQELAEDLLLTATADGATISYKENQLLEGDPAQSSASFLRKFSDGSEVEIYVYNTATNTNDYSNPFEVSVSETRNGCGREGFRYELSRDGLKVIRVDLGDAMEKAKSFPQPKINPPASAAIGLLQAQTLLADIENEIKNDELEESMGLNSQPVSADEITRLRELVKPAEVQRLVGLSYDGDKVQH